MAIGTAILLGVGLYLAAALPVAVVIGRLLGGPPVEVALARAASAPALTLPAQRVSGRPVGAQVAAGRPVTLVTLHPQAPGNLQLAGAEAHPAHA